MNKKQKTQNQIDSLSNRISNLEAIEVNCIFTSVNSPIRKIEKNGNDNKDTIRELENQLSCGARTGHLFAIKHVYGDEGERGCLFHCIKCDLEYQKSRDVLNEKEQNLLKTVLGN